MLSDIRLAEGPASKALQRARLPELDGLRGCAILFVLFHHCYPASGVFGWLALFGQAGWMGVDLFFVLSGYLITGILLDTVERPHYYRNFVARRTLRIFPLYYVCLGLFTAATWLSGGRWWRDMVKWGLGWFVVYCANIRVAALNVYPPNSWFAPLWSLQVEEQFYLVYPLVVRLYSRRNLRRFLLACVMLAPLLRLLLSIIVPKNFVALYVLTPCRMDALALGGLVTLLARAPAAQLPSTQIRAGALVMSSTAIALYAWVLQLNPAATASHPLMSTLGYSVNALSCALILAMAVLWPSTSLAGILRWRPLVYTGQRAYGLYLLHMPASWVARKLMMTLFRTDINVHSAVSILITLVASFLAAAISWRLLEAPILGLKERFTVAETRSPTLSDTNTSRCLLG